MADYNIWSTNTFIGWLEQITDQQWERVITSSFSSVKQTVTQIVSAERIWLDFWREMPEPAFLSTVVSGTKDDLLDSWKKTSADLKNFINNLPEEKYLHTVTFSWRGVVRQMEFWQTFAHFINHATYHRGQLVTLLRQTGYTQFSSTDLATFFWKH